jgi:hypothetical protein
MRAPAPILAALIVGAPLPGCAATLPPGATVAADTGSGRVILQDDLRGEVTVEPPQVGESWGGLTEVETDVRNITENAQLTVEYRYEFLDDRGRALKPVDEWARVVLRRAQPRTLAGGSLASRVDAWRLTIRRAD